MTDWFKNVWTGFSQSTQEFYEQRLLSKWGKVRACRVTNTQISADPKDTIHSISVNCDVFGFCVISGAEKNVSNRERSHSLYWYQDTERLQECTIK